MAHTKPVRSGYSTPQENQNPTQCKYDLKSRPGKEISVPRDAKTDKILVLSHAHGELRWATKISYIQKGKKSINETFVSAFT